MNTQSFTQVFNFSQVAGPCGPVPSHELFHTKPLKVQVQTPQLITAVPRSKQQLKSFPEENGVKQVSDIPIRATISTQKKFLFLQFSVFRLQCIFFSSCSLFFVEPESQLLCVYQACSSGISKETWDLILSQTLYIDQERLSSSREVKCLTTDKTAPACMVNEYFVDQVQAANSSTADRWELRRSMRIIINTFRGQ